MEFEKRKSATMASLGSTETDKSPKGSLDAPILPLLTAINSHPSFFTTSSCSGRISILSQPSSSSSTAEKKKARGGTWLYISHSPADPDSVVALLFPPVPTAAPPSELVFRFEPLILAVECRDLASAQFLVSTAISCGFRESGITSANGKRVIVAVRCSIRMEVPLGDSNDISVSREYVMFLVRIANEKMQANARRTEGFFQTLLQTNGFGDTEELLDGSGDDAESLNYIEGLGKDASFDKRDGDSEVYDRSLSVTQLKVLGNPIEKLFLWGHSACTVEKGSNKKVLVHGGFGGMGRHARRNDSLLLDPLDGKLVVLDTIRTPSPRMGHTASLIGEQMFVIGGRADPANILSEVWALNTATNEWSLLNCTGDFFPPRHRHAATVIDSNIYVFGGLNNDKMFSSIFVFDKNSLRWEELQVGGEQPCARHSHSMVAFGSQIFMFGGYNGERALGDLYSLNVESRTWRKEKPSGRSPYARFSHSMFIYKHYIGIIGGCPVKQHFQELSLLDMHSQSWKHFSLSSVGKYLFVRSTVSVVGDELVIVGGGASCYAFGTKFSEPTKIALLALTASNNFSSNGQQVQHPKDPQSLGEMLDSNSDVGHKVVAQSPPNWFLQFEKKHAKLGKDLLKKSGWLHLGRKVYTSSDGAHICFPVTEQFYTLFYEAERVDSSRGTSLGLESNKVELHFLEESLGRGNSFNEISSSMALNLLKQFCGTCLAYETAEARKSGKPPSMVMREAVASLIKQRDLPEKLLEQLPSRWEKLGDIVVLPATSFMDPIWDTMGEELWPIIAKVLKTHRLARQGCVASTGTRDSTLKMLRGDNGWVDHHENGILYSFDATKCMFSWGNLPEKLRMGRLDCQDEVVVDLFAGIGYFTLPFLVRAKAKLVYACEWNPHAIEALHHNLRANCVADRCIVLEGDNRITAPKGVADRVCLGLLPTSEASWVTAVRALRDEGGTLHIHGNVKDSDENTWVEHVASSIDRIATSEGHYWEVTIEHLEKVKWYAPHVRHLVADVRCKEIRRLSGTCSKH